MSDTPVPHYTDSTVTLHHGDCLDVLRSLPDASVDSVVTDPPYGLEFMGKAWDSFGTDTGNGYRETPRITDRPDAVSADSAGGKGVNIFQAGRPFQSWCTLWAAECLRVLKPGGHLLAFGGTRTYHRLACAVEDAGFEIRDSIAWMYGSGFPKSLNLVDADGERTGWGTALKPAFEPIVVARKPLAGTVAGNVLAHGTGALNIDGCRVEGEVPSVPQPAYGVKADGVTDFGAGVGRNGVMSSAPGGRWPANVILDESQAEVLDEQSGSLTSGKMQPTHTTAGVGGRASAFGADAAGGFTTMETYGDTGGASRFYYVAKADASERVRVDGIAHPTVKPLSLMRWLVRLVTPPGGTILEPFAGSGTTVEACILEGFRCIAIEREADYLPLIQQRIHRRRDPVAAVKATGEDGGLFDLLNPNQEDQ